MAEKMTEEIFDIVDEAGCPTGETVSRKRAHAEGIRHRTAHIWVVRREKNGWELLLQQRSACKDSFPNEWDTSSAGHIHAGDEPLPSALRELEEELGITAAADQLHFAGTFTIAYEKPFHGSLFKDNEISFVYVYSDPVDVSALKLQAEEVQAAAFFPEKAVEEACLHRDGTVCVPLEGLRTVQKWLRAHE